LSALPTSGQEQPKYWTDYKHPVKFESLTVEDGLSQSSVLCILQDSKGFLWYGTEDGLNRYDGYHFTPFRPEPGNPYSINHNVIFSLFEDREGLIWVGTNGGGINIFDPRSERFSHYSFATGKDGTWAIDNIYCIYEDSRGDIWVGSEGGLLKKKRDETAFLRYRRQDGDSESISSNAITSIYQDSRGDLWFCCDTGGLDKLINKTFPPDYVPRFNHYLDVPSATGTLRLDRVMAVDEDQNGLMWVGTQNGLYSFNRDTGLFTAVPVTPPTWDMVSKSISHPYIRLIYKDRVGVLWIGTDGGGLEKLLPGTDTQSPTFMHHHFDPNNPDTLNGNGIQSIYEDRTGVLWVGIYQGGLNKLVLNPGGRSNRETAQFAHYHPIANVSNSLSHNIVNAVHEDRNGRLWIGTDGGGLNLVSAPDADVKPLNFYHYRREPGNPDGLSDDIVTSIYEDSAETLWIGTYTGGLNKHSPGKSGYDRFIHFKNKPDDPASLSNNFVMCCYEDSEGDFWVGTIQGGLNLMDRQKGSFTCFLNHPDDGDSLSDNNVFCLFEDNHRNLWVGTAAGLNRMIKKPDGQSQGLFRRYVSDPNDPTTIGSNFIRCIYQDSSGTLWFGTNGGGLNRFNPGRQDKGDIQGSFTSYRESDGLPGNVVVGILEDQKGNLWLSTTRGLARFNPKTGAVTKYDKRDGLQGDEFNRGAFCKTKSGEMIFGGNNGFNIFHPDRILENNQAPTVVITDFQVFNRSVPIGEPVDGRTLLQTSITETKQLTLSHLDYIFSFQFAALHYLNPSRNQYAYIMEGLETHWNYVGNRRFVTYSTLPHGDYLFRVKASNNDGIWNETGTSIKITITPPFWKTWWFYTIMALLGILSATGIHIYRVRKIVSKIKKKYEKTAIKADKADKYLKTLLTYMKMGKPFLDPHLTLRTLAKKVAIPHHYLSQIINDKLNKIFFDFINQYRIDEAVKKLNDPAQRQKTVQQIAHEVGFNSQSAFNRAFKKQTDTTPFEFINQCRINEAEEKLTDPAQINKSINKIAEEIGFSSLSSFNRAFKKITGKTPTQYRKHE